MTATAPEPAVLRRLAPARPGWVRVSLLAATLLLGWAALLPVGQRPQWWHWALAGLVVVGFLGSWNGQHISTAVGRWAPMAWRNRRRRRHPGTTDAPAAAPAGDDELRSRITIHLRPQPHALNTPDAHDDQLPWQFVTAWLDRYGIRADALTVCSVTRTPPPSSLRSDAAAQLTARTPQHRDTWLTYTLTAESNVGALVARRTALSTIEEEPGDAEGPGRQRTGLSAVTARRLIAELRERGWLASLCEDTAELPVFVPATVGVRRECWTGTEYSDGFRAVYAVDPQQIDAVLDTLPAVPTKATWVAVTVRAHRTGPTTVEACVGMLTPARPPLQPMAGLTGFHGLHRQATQALGIAGLEQTGEVGALPQCPVDVDALAALPWATAAMGVPIGFDRTRRPVYVGLSSPEPVRVTVTGTGDFHAGVLSRLALAGSPIAIYTRDPRRWTQLANHGGPEQIRINPATVTPTTIVVSDGGGDIPPGAVSVLLRRPQAAPPPATSIVITQDPRRPELFTIITARGRQWLSLRL